MYAKCGALAKAQEVFDDLPDQDVVSWTALIAGYAHYGQGQEAIDCFERMQLRGLSPNAVTFTCILKACASVRAFKKGLEIHAEIVTQGMLQNFVLVGTALVDLYVKCGALAKAQEVFDGLPMRDAISWNALIAGYSQHGLGQEALNCFTRMQLGGLSPDAVTFTCILKACGSIGDLKKGQEIHGEIVRKGLLQKSSAVGTALVDMYAKCGALAKAQQVFDELPIRDVISWNALIAAYAHQGHGEETIKCFERMQIEGLSPDEITFACILKACGSTGALDKGQEIHTKIARQGLFGKDVVIGNALVDMYAKCGALTKAEEVFITLPLRDNVTWTALLAGYVQRGQGKEAINCFDRMKLGGLSPDAVTYVCILKACSSIGALEKGQEIHAEIRRQGLLERDLVVGNALIDMYAKCGLLVKAQEVFDELLVKDAVSWNSLISSYAHNGHNEEAINCYERMQWGGLFPDVFTLSCILKACCSIGAVDKGQEIHAKIAQEGLLENNNVVGTALVAMYAKCGALQKAQEVFDDLPDQNVVSWNALLAGHAQLGKDTIVFSSFQRMLEEGKVPDVVTFTILLNTCRHSGLLEKGQMYFDSMSISYGIVPTWEHHSCMVDLFSRAGHLDKAMAVIKKMPFSANPSVWHTILGACQKWGNVEIGELAFEQALQLGENDAAAYICMSNIYADAGMLEAKDKIEALKLRRNGASTVLTVN